MNQPAAGPALPKGGFPSVEPKDTRRPGKRARRKLKKVKSG